MPTEVRTYAGGQLQWIDIVDPDADELAEAGRRYDLHPLALEDVVKHDQRPKLEHYPAHAFVVAYSAGLQEVDLFVGDGWLLCVRERDSAGAVWDDAIARSRFERLSGEDATVGFLLYVLLDELVDGYFACADEAETMLEDVEDLVFGPARAGELSPQHQLFAIRSRLVTYRRRVVPLRDVVASLLRGEVASVDERARVHLQDVHDHILRVVDQFDAHRELVSSAVDAHLAVVSNALNQVMKRMTSWGAILLLSTLIAGIYGMNFEHMPELGWRYGYPMALGIMALLTIGGYRYFRRKDWL